MSGRCGGGQDMDTDNKQTNDQKQEQERKEQKNSREKQQFEEPNLRACHNSVGKGTCLQV